MNTVEVRNVSKYYGKAKEQNLVINRLNMTVTPGSIYGLMGGSGCGKTTLLMCILGMLDVDGGEISVLGFRSKAEKALKAAPKVGFMPQEASMIGELTIKETIYYFGKIFQVGQEKLRQRYKMLKELLELPKGNHRLNQCSGGQQRRVSFASAMIHEPDLLILDEPTVGLDPILRQKIWNFIRHVTQTSQCAVIITTHYIDEAKQADRCGMMRNGILLAEDSPNKIISRCEVDHLEEAFMKLCMHQGSVINESKKSIDQDDFEMIHSYELLDEPVTDCKLEHSKRKTFQWNTMSALLTKNLLQIKRLPAGFICMITVPIIQLLFFYWAVGGNPIGLKIGIVNEEIKSYDDCLDKSLITAATADYRCRLYKVSCQFLIELHDDVAIKIFYKNLSDAKADAKKGKIIGIIHFASNFTDSLQTVHKLRKHADKGSRTNGKINFYLDQTNQQLSVYIMRKLYETYTSYSETTMVSCKLPKRLYNIPIEYQQPIFGELNGDFKDTMAPNLIVTMMFYLAMGLTATVFIQDRKEGFWNRTLLAGVTSSEMMTAHFIVQSAILMIQFIEIVAVVAFFFKVESIGSISVLALLLILLGLSGMSLGLFLSCFCDDMSQAVSMVLGLSQPMVILSGTIWPLEGMPTVCRYVAYTLPFTLPSIAIRDIMLKGYTIFDQSVLIGFGIIFIWTILGIFTALKVLQKKKFSISLK